MGSVTGTIPDDMESWIDEQVEKGVYDSKSEAVRKLLKYSISNKYGEEF